MGEAGQQKSKVRATIKNRFGRFVSMAIAAIRDVHHEECVPRKVFDQAMADKRSRYARQLAARECEISREKAAIATERELFAKLTAQFITQRLYSDSRGPRRSANVFRLMIDISPEMAYVMGRADRRELDVIAQYVGRNVEGELRRTRFVPCADLDDWRSRDAIAGPLFVGEAPRYPR